MRMVRALRLLACIMAAILLAGCAGAPATAPRSAETVLAAEDTSGRYIRTVFNDVEVTKDIEYGVAKNEKGEEEKLLLDIYQPKGDTAKRRPAVIFVHGGGFTSGDKGSGIERKLAERLARKGYVTVSINYRLRETPGTDWAGTYRDSTDDAYRAYTWLADHQDEYRVDSDHIAFGGHSAGSYIVVNLCYTSWGWAGRKLSKDGVFAVVAMAGPELWNGDPKPDDPFCLIIHGKRDETVPYSLSEQLEKTLKQSRTSYLMYPMPLMPHNLEPAIDEVDDTVTSTLYRALTGRDSGITIRTYENECRQMINGRLKNNLTIKARTLAANIDGKLNEWPQDGFIKLDALKDAGAAMPAPSDLEAYGMVAWDKDKPGCILAAVKVQDDSIQSDGSPNHWENDSVELLLDLSDGTTIRPIIQWTVNVNGTDIYCSTGRTGACEAKTVREGNTVTYEIRADIGLTAPELAGFDPRGKTIGISLCCNDGDNGIKGVREHQVGLVAGDTWTPLNFANLVTGGE